MKWIEYLTRQNTMTNKGVAIHRILFPVVHLLHIVASGCRLHYLHRAKVSKAMAPCIYVANHSNCHDLPTMSRVINKPFFVLASDEPKSEFAGFGLWISGVIWSNRMDINQRKRAKQRCIDCLKMGCSLLIFPEGTWNITPAKPMLPLSWGVIEIAQKTNSPIVPVALEYSGKDCTVNMGEPYYLSSGDPADKKCLCDELRDKLASLRWECWEAKGSFRRAEVTQKDYEEYSTERIREYGLLTEEQILSWVRR